MSYLIDLKSRIQRCFDHDESGTGLVEYVLVTALIAIVCIGAIGLLGDGVDGVLSDAASTLP